MNELKGMLQSGIEEKMYLGAINLRNMLTMGKQLLAYIYIYIYIYI